MSLPQETFAPLRQFPFIIHTFTRRTDADTRSDHFRQRLLAQFNFAAGVSAEQPHGAGVGVADPTGPAELPDVDALITDHVGLPLLIRCADCAAVYIVDRTNRAIGLAHSGKAGTNANIVAATLDAMRAHFGTAPANCRAVISPCIGPCHYEMDIPGTIEQQLRAAGVTDLHNSSICTACHLDRYFSYRAEKGQTGRMFALLALR